MDWKSKQRKKKQKINNISPLEVRLFSSLPWAAFMNPRKNLWLLWSWGSINKLVTSRVLASLFLCHFLPHLATLNQRETPKHINEENVVILQPTKFLNKFSSFILWKGQSYTKQQEKRLQKCINTTVNGINLLFKFNIIEITAFGLYLYLPVWQNEVQVWLWLFKILWV